MNLPDLKKGTSASVAVVPQFDVDGALVAVVLIKEAFAVDRRDRVRRVGGAEVHAVDVPWDEDAPETSSIRFPSDVCVRKPATDVVVVGSAVAAYRVRQRQLDVTVRVGAMERVVRVFGPRVWYRGAFGWALSDPTDFDALPLRWESAWGGADFSDPSAPLEEPRNPAGRGLVRDPASLEGQLGPSIEDPRDLLETHRSRPAPAGLGAVGRHFAPRRTFAGTADDRWMRERMPLPPEDFDDRFNQFAAPGLTAEGRLRGGEAVLVNNMCEQGPMAFELPRMAFFTGARVRGALAETPAVIDTVTLVPNDRRVEITWRATLPMPRSFRSVEYIQVHEKEWRA
ncbi:MAG: DUF2169 domain-containing protein [Polyangiales bacterium]